MSFLSDKVFGTVVFTTVCALNLHLVRSLASAGLAKSTLPPSKPRSQAPKAKKIEEKIVFGVKGDEYRGENPMNPPRV